MQARKYGKIGVITGVCGSKGHIRNKVNIPAYWYKILFLPNGKRIGFLAPNTNVAMARARAKEFLAQVGKIEEMCGFALKRIE